jgi:hypothetical protein
MTEEDILPGGGLRIVGGRKNLHGGWMGEFREQLIAKSEVLAHPDLFGRFTHRLIYAIERFDTLCSGSSQKIVPRLVKGANVDMLVPACGRPHAINEGSERGSSYARFSYRYSENDEAHKEEITSTHQPLPAPGFAQSSRMFAFTASQRPPALMVLASSTHL